MTYVLVLMFILTSQTFSPWGIADQNMMNVYSYAKRTFLVPSIDLGTKMLVFSTQPFPFAEIAPATAGFLAQTREPLSQEERHSLLIKKKSHSFKLYLITLKYKPIFTDSRWQHIGGWRPQRPANSDEFCGGSTS